MTQLLPDPSTALQHEEQELEAIRIDTFQATRDGHRRVFEKYGDDEEMQESLFILKSNTELGSCEVSANNFINTYSKVNIVDSYYLGF